MFGSTTYNASSQMELYRKATKVATDPWNNRWIAPLLICIDAIICGGIIWKVPYTEIDWKAYMEQVKQYIEGERVYTEIRGGTGPLVYPGFHVYIYRVMYTITDRGNDIHMAQVIFAVLYITSLALVLACYHKGGAPPYILPLLILSKRLHSIFVLRCFNDCFAVAALWLAIFFYQRRMWTAGSVCYTCGLGIKMNLLLVLPTVGIVLLQAVGRDRAITQAILIGQFQVLFGLPFLRRDPIAYVSQAFNFSREFLYKWTVNWRFVDEVIFLSKSFSYILITFHIGILVLFASTRWIKPSGLSFPGFLKNALQTAMSPSTQTRNINGKFIMTAMLTANVIGMLCARSLHYQFYSWTAWSTPFLLWRANIHPLLLYILWALQEWAWNVYPSTPHSSQAVVGVLAVTVGGVWWGTKGDYEESPSHPHVE